VHDRQLGFLPADGDKVSLRKYRRHVS
jgi:hypothetical protein